MPVPVPTVDELVATIKHASLPNVIVEGPDDMNIYRWIEGMLGPFNGNILPCGGRIALLELFERRAEFAGRKAVFVADRDMWLFTSIPTEYAEVIFTRGYSIENDIYLDSDIERLLDPSEAAEHRLLVEVIAAWFAFEVEEYRAGQPFQVETHINEIVPLGSLELDTNFISKRGYLPATPDTVTEIRDNYQLNIRGKQLFDMLVRFLSGKRTPKHSRLVLIENCVKTRNHPNIERLIAEIRLQLTASV